MKKSLLALAIFGAFAGAASAQSSVTVYGIVDASVSSIDNGGKGSKIGLDDGNNASSRIGFKGVEDLGNGLKAEFVLENGFDVSTGDAKSNTTNGTASVGAFSRLAYVGLNGGFGTVRMGRQNTQIKEALSSIDPFGTSGMVNGVNYYNGGGVAERVANQITYNSNNYGGFSGRVGYVFGEQEDDTGAGQGYGVQLGYANGPLNVQFGYNNQNTTTAGVDRGDREDTILGATYDFGAFKLHGAYGQQKTDGFAGAADIKIKTAMIGATVPFGASALRAEYINNNDDRADADNNIFAIGYTYSMSKRTTLYATYAHVENDDNSRSMGIGGAGKLSAAAPLGESADGFAVGIQHNF